MAMTQASAAQAMQSPYYGIKGWLLVLYIILALGALSSVTNAFNADLARVSGMGETGWMLFSLIGLALSLPFLVLTPMKHRLMPVLTIIGMWVGVAITLIRDVLDWETIVAASQKVMLQQVAAAGSQPLPTEFYMTMAAWIPIGGVAVQIVFALLFTWYLLASKRVNATFRHRLPHGMADLPTTAAPSHGSAM